MSNLKVGDLVITLRKTPGNGYVPPGTNGVIQKIDSAHSILIRFDIPYYGSITQSWWYSSEEVQKFCFTLMKEDTYELL